MNPGIAQNVAAKFSLRLFIKYQKLIGTDTSTNSNMKWQKDLENDHDGFLLLKPSSKLEIFVKEFNNATPENSNDPEKISPSDYKNILKEVTKKIAISIPYKSMFS